MQNDKIENQQQILPNYAQCIFGFAKIGGDIDRHERTEVRLLSNLVERGYSHKHELQLLAEIINPRCACAARVTVVVLCVCVSVTTFSATVRNKAAKKRYQRVQRYTGFILKLRFS